MEATLENSKLRFLDWNGADLHLVFCYEGGIPPVGKGQTTARFNSAWRVMTGWVEVTCEGLPAVRGQPGDWVFLPPGQRLQRFSDDAQILSIAFVANHLLNQPIFRDGLPVALKAASSPPLDRSANRFLKLATGGRKNFRFDTWEMRGDMGAYLKLKIAFLQWLVSFTTALEQLDTRPKIQATADPLVADVLRIIRNLANRQELKVADLAERTGISTSQLHRRFTRSTGVSLHRYYSQIRLEAVVERVRRSKDSLKEIAYDMGFQHPANFSNWFKAKTGMTPSDYRARRT